MQDIIADHVANAHRQAESSPLVAVQATRKAADAIAHDSFLRRGGRGVPPTSDAIVRELVLRGACTPEVAKAFETVAKSAADAQRVAPGPDAMKPMLAALRAIATWYWGEILKSAVPASIAAAIDPASAAAPPEPRRTIADEDEERGGTLVMRSKPKLDRQPADPAREESRRPPEAAAARRLPVPPPRAPAYAPAPPPARAPVPESDGNRLPIALGIAVGVLVLALVIVIVVL